MSSSPAVLGPPVFSGGTGRSGTTVVAKLLDAHPLVAHGIPFECKFLTSAGGLCDLVDTRLRRGPVALARRLARGSVESFEEQLRGRWFRHRYGDGRERGLCQGIDAATVEAALAGFADRLAADPVAAAHRLTHDLLDPPARSRGKQRWVDTTPGNAWRARSLHRIFPDLRLVHMMRDGRDVAASVAPRYWGPDDVDEALAWWEDRMRRSGEALRALPEGSVVHVELEDLVLRDRDATRRRLLAVLGLDDDPAVAAYHDTAMKPDHAHLERWRHGLTPARQDELTERYLAALDRLRAAGLPAPTP